MVVGGRCRGNDGRRTEDRGRAVVRPGVLFNVRAMLGDRVLVADLQSRNCEAQRFALASAAQAGLDAPGALPGVAVLMFDF